MKYLLILTLLFSVNSCKRKKDDPLVIPPGFNILPNPDKPEENNQNQDLETEELKNLLLKDTN